MNGTLKCDHIKRLITLTGDYIKRLSLYIAICSITGAGNSLGFAGHIKDKLGIRESVHTSTICTSTIWIEQVFSESFFYDEAKIIVIFNVF